MSSVRFKADTAILGVPVPSPDGRRVAGVYRPKPGVTDNVARQIVVTDLNRLDERGRAVGTPVPEFKANAVYGWRDDRHVIAERQRSEPGIYAVDIDTGEATLVMTRVGQNWDAGLQVAAEAWQAPVVAAAEPRWPWNPRLRTAPRGRRDAARAGSR